MKAYTNKTDRIDHRKCTYAEISGNDRAGKKAKRREGKKEIELELSLEDFAFDSRAFELYKVGKHPAFKK